MKNKIGIFRPISYFISKTVKIHPFIYVFVSRKCPHENNNAYCSNNADDTHLLVPKNTNVDLVDEFSNIREWADSNGMVINLHKTVNRQL